MNSYQHTQRSPLHLLLYVPAVYTFFVAWQLRYNTPPSIGVMLLGLVLIWLALSFRSLTVSDDGDELEVVYGPNNLFGTRIPYADITDVEVGETSLIDGWGIHFIPFRGWTVNLWGFECVVIKRGDKTIRIGTDDSVNLCRFLRKRCGLDRWRKQNGIAQESSVSSIDTLNRKEATARG